MDWLWGYALALIAVNVLALISGLLTRRHRAAWIGLLLAFYVGVINRGFLAIPSAVLGWWKGGARIQCCGLPAEWPEPDRETRLPVSCSCTCDWREARIPNTVLTLLHRYVSPATGTWQGKIPEPSEADTLIATRGVELALKPLIDDREVRLFGGHCHWEGEWRGRSLSFWSCRALRGMSPRTSESWNPRVAELEGDGLLLADGDSLSVWLPSEPRDEGDPIYHNTWTLRGYR